MNCQLTVEVTLLRCGANFDDDGNGNHDSDEKEASTVNAYFQVGMTGGGVLSDSYRRDRTRAESARID